MPALPVQDGRRYHRDRAEVVINRRQQVRQSQGNVGAGVKQNRGNEQYSALPRNAAEHFSSFCLKAGGRKWQFRPRIHIA
jgi:hypothetical protein